MKEITEEPVGNPVEETVGNSIEEPVRKPTMRDITLALLEKDVELLEASIEHINQDQLTPAQLRHLQVWSVATALEWSPEFIPLLMEKLNVNILNLDFAADVAPHVDGLAILVEKEDARLETIKELDALFRYDFSVLRHLKPGSTAETFFRNKFDLPDYIRDYGVKEREFSFPALPMPDEAVDLVQKALERDCLCPVDREGIPCEIAEKLWSNYALGLMRDKLDIVEPFASFDPIDKETEEAAFRWLGPINSGGCCGHCRMFTCGEDWFTPTCLKCEKPLFAPHRALRRPLPSGGWAGCYCSWDCVYDDSLPQEHAGIDHVKALVEAIGIQSR